MLRGISPLTTRRSKQRERRQDVDLSDRICTQKQNEQFSKIPHCLKIWDFNLFTQTEKKWHMKISTNQPIKHFQISVGMCRMKQCSLASTFPQIENKEYIICHFLTTIIFFSLLKPAGDGKSEMQSF